MEEGKDAPERLGSAFSLNCNALPGTMSLFLTDGSTASTPTANVTAPGGAPTVYGVKPDDEYKISFDYALKWFFYHADQRMKAFNFMILTFGVLSTAIVTAIDKGLVYVTASLALISSITAFLFSRLDSRNEELVNKGRLALKQLEQQFQIKTTLNVDNKMTDNIPIVSLIYNGQDKQHYISSTLQGRHKRIIPLFAYVFCAIFFVTFSFAAIPTWRSILFSKEVVHLPQGAKSQPEPSKD